MCFGFSNAKAAIQPAISYMIVSKNMNMAMILNMDMNDSDIEKAVI